MGACVLACCAYVEPKQTNQTRLSDFYTSIQSLPSFSEASSSSSSSSSSASRSCIVYSVQHPEHPLLKFPARRKLGIGRPGLPPPSPSIISIRPEHACAIEIQCSSIISSSSSSGSSSSTELSTESTQPTLIARPGQASLVNLQSDIGPRYCYATYNIHIYLLATRACLRPSPPKPKPTSAAKQTSSSKPMCHMSSMHPPA